MTQHRRRCPVFATQRDGEIVTSGLSSDEGRAEAHREAAGQNERATNAAMAKPRSSSGRIWSSSTLPMRRWNAVALKVRTVLPQSGSA